MYVFICLWMVRICHINLTNVIPVEWKLWQYTRAFTTTGATESRRMQSRPTQKSIVNSGWIGQFKVSQETLWPSMECHRYVQYHPGTCDHGTVRGTSCPTFHSEARGEEASSWVWASKDTGSGLSQELPDMDMGVASSRLSAHWCRRPQLRTEVTHRLFRHCRG